MVVELPDFLLYAGIVVMFGLIIQNIWHHRLYKKAVDYGAKADMTIQELKTQLLEKDKLVDLKDVLYNTTTVFGPGKIPFTSQTGGLLDKQSISFNGDKYEFKEVRIKPLDEIKSPVGEIEREKDRYLIEKLGMNIYGQMTWGPLPRKWRNNTFAELNEALENANKLFDYWEREPGKFDGHHPNSWKIKQHELIDAIYGSFMTKYDIVDGYGNIVARGFESAKDCLDFIHKQKEIWKMAAAYQRRNFDEDDDYE